jgi:B-cell receptor-associated protein 31
MLLYLSSVIRRLMTLLAAQAALSASNEAAMKQAASASKTAKDLMDKKHAPEETNSKENQETLNKIMEELAEAKKGMPISKLFLCAS